MNISTGCFCAKRTESHVILECNTMQYNTIQHNIFGGSACVHGRRQTHTFLYE